MLCNDNKRCERKVVLSRRVVSFDRNIFGLISGKLTNLYEGLKKIFKPTFNYRAILFSVMKKKLQNVACKFLLFCIYTISDFVAFEEAEPQGPEDFAHDTLSKILTKHHIFI